MVATSAEERPNRPPVVLLLLPAAVLLLVAVLTPASALFPHQGDVLLYFYDGFNVLHGELPYRDFAFEYPPLAILPMLLPQLVATDMPFEAFEWTFIGQEALLAIVGAWLIWRIAALGEARDPRLPSPTLATATWAIAVVAGAPFFAFRFDLFPTILALAGLYLALTDRPGSAGVVLGAGALMKIFPAVLIPILVVRCLARNDWYGSIRLVGGALLLVAAVIGPLAIRLGSDGLSFLAYQQSRPLQIESLVAGLILGVHDLTDMPTKVVQVFGSVGIEDAAASAFLRIQLPLMLAGLALASALAWFVTRERGGHQASSEEPDEDEPETHHARPSQIVALCTAAILVLILTNKVFSVQYVVWFLPFVCLLPAGPAALGVVVGALSVVIHPLNYVALMNLDPLMVWVLNVRNGLVLILLAWVLIGAISAAARPGQAAARPAEAS